MWILHPVLSKKPLMIHFSLTPVLRSSRKAAHTAVMAEHYLFSYIPGSGPLRDRIQHQWRSLSTTTRVSSPALSGFYCSGGRRLLRKAPTSSPGYRQVIQLLRLHLLRRRCRVLPNRTSFARKHNNRRNSHNATDARPLPPPGISLSYSAVTVRTSRNQRPKLPSNGSASPSPKPSSKLAAANFSFKHPAKPSRAPGRHLKRTKI